MKQLVYTFLLALCLEPYASAQDGLGFQQSNRLAIHRTSEKIKIDGRADEMTWNSSQAATDFWEKWPNDKDRAKRRTEVRMTYDDQNIYIFVKAFDTSRYVIQTLKRDNGIYDSDAFSIALDPVNQRTNGFLFSVNPYNVQTEDLVSANAGGDLNFSWDNKWFSATERHETYWTAEIAIPFKTLRYEAGKKTWGINFLRSDLKNNQYSSWTHMPVNFPFYDFGYAGALEWDAAPPPPGTNISFIPYITASGRQNREENEPLTGKFNAGFDGKVAVSPSLNLDITVNPDFSQVEVDRQVTNLTRFDIFFPERRTFFLENDDIFSGYGIPPIRPFYSRRIGLDDEGQTIPIIGGLRLSGNLNRKMRIGVMNMQTLSQDGYPAQNYTAATFNQRVQARSLVKGYFLNRQAFTGESTLADPLDAFGRNAGLEYNYSDNAGRWNAWAGYHHSFKPGIHEKNLYLNAGGMYAGKKFEAVIDYSDIGDQFYADMGFVNRIENYDAKLDTVYRAGFRHIFNSYQFRIFPKSIYINQHRIGLENYTVWNRDGSLNESSHFMVYEILMRNTSNFRFNTGFTYNNLPYYIRFTDDIYEPLPPGTYQYLQGNIRYGTDSRKKFIAQAGLTYGGFYNGTIFQSSLSLTFRAQPWGNFTLNIENASLRFPSPYGSTNLILVAP
ncbi:MAG: carbohydrate binding family 9 domain-containing protein, partial [Chitinophagaceae bacterium]|nr:carbohydrate binding family 9 domain-containing protein [Chitinophagaceae bacterium]